MHASMISSLIPSTCDPSTPPKRIRKEVVLTPGSDEEDHELGTKRPKDTPILSYTDSNGAPGFELPSSQLGFLNPDDIDGVPIDAGLPVVKAEKRSTQIAISTRPLIRRATDFPLPPPSPTQTYAPSPRSAEIILKKVLGIPEPSSDPVAAWRRQRDNHLCPLCLGVLVRPVDVAGCGHFVCRTHVLDIYQHGGSREGIRCCVCRKEEKVEDFNKVEIDQRMWSKILRSKFHPSQRRSVSPSRSLTPLRDRFNRKFFKCEEDF